MPYQRSWNEKKFCYYFTPEWRRYIYLELRKLGIKPIIPNETEFKYGKMKPHPTQKPYYVFQFPVVLISGGLETTEVMDEYWMPKDEIDEVLKEYDRIEQSTRDLRTSTEKVLS